MHSIYMAKFCALFSLSLTSFLLLFNGCFGQQQSREACLNLKEIKPMEPTIVYEAEGGKTEFWYPLDDQFLCGSAHVFRHIIRPNGLLLPSHTNAPLVAYVLQGSGEFGIVFPGCQETFMSTLKIYGKQQSDVVDRYQRIGSYRDGDVIVFPEGALHWVHNTDNSKDTVLVVLQDSSNDDNQLDAIIPHRFFLAGKMQENQRSSREFQGREGKQGQQQEDPTWLREQLGYVSNIMAGFQDDVQMVMDAFSTTREIAEKIVGKGSKARGHIILADKGVQSSVPPEQSQSGRPHQSSNGIEQTLCSPRLVQNFDDPPRADIYHPDAGRFATLNSLTLPIFDTVRLSAARGSLNQNWGIVPRWCQNAHSFVYVTKGSAQVKILRQNGEVFLDDVVQEGQLFLVPQEYVVVKQAVEKVFEWVEFNTNNNAIYNTLTGRTSTFTALPAHILAQSYDLTISQAMDLKASMLNAWFYQASSPSPSSGSSAFI